MAARSHSVALRSVGAYECLAAQKGGLILPKPTPRGVTSAGAMMHGAESEQSRAGSVGKASMALKGACVAQCRLRLLHGGGYLDDDVFAYAIADARQLARMHVPVVKSAKANSLEYDSHDS